MVEEQDFAATVEEAATELSAGPTLALASIKAAVNHSSASTLDGALEFEASLMTLTGKSTDHKNAVEAFLSKRKPEFVGS